jgi:class I fructose-bisphosphate aldolase
MSFLGKKIRLKRIMKRRFERFLGVAIDHGIARGILPGLEQIGKKLEQIAEGKPDAITMHKGIAEHFFEDYTGEIALILKCTSFSPYHPTYDTWVTQVEEAIRLGAEAISMGVIVGGDEQPEMLRNLGMLTKEAASAGLPVIAHIYPGGSKIPDEDRYSPSNIAYAARVGAELGVDIVKTWYTGSAETFRKVVESCPTRVVVAGGPKLESIEELLRMTKDSLSAGAVGVTYGRNIWQYQDPPCLIRALSMIIHDDSSVQGALEVLKADV